MAEAPAHAELPLIDVVDDLALVLRALDLVVVADIVAMRALMPPRDGHLPLRVGAGADVVRAEHGRVHPRADSTLGERLRGKERQEAESESRPRSSDSKPMRHDDPLRS